MTPKYKIILCILVMMIQFSSCNPFSRDVENCFIPPDARVLYNNTNQIIIYRSSNNELDSIYIKELESDTILSDEYSHYENREHKFINFNNTDNNSIYRIYQSCDRSIITLYGNTEEKYETFYLEYNGSPDISNIELYDKTYQDVYTHDLDSFPYNGHILKKVYITHTHGIIKYVDYNGEEWGLYSWN